MQKIDFSNIPTDKSINGNILMMDPDLVSNPEHIEHAVIKNDSFEENLQYLASVFPCKILFEIREVSEILGQSYETIRQQIHKGRIKAKSYGRRKMIHKNELAKLITEGF